MSAEPTSAPLPAPTPQTPAAEAPASAAAPLPVPAQESPSVGVASATRDSAATDEEPATGQTPAGEEHPGELTLVVIREHWRALVFPLVAAAVLVAGLVWLFMTVQENFFGRAAFFLALQVAVPAWIWRGGRPIVRWFRTAYVLTSRRVLIRRGFLDFDEDPIELLQCANLRLHMSLVDRAFGSGTIQLVQGKFMVRVPSAKKLQKDITELHDNHAAGTAELYDLLLRLGYNVAPRM